MRPLCNLWLDEASWQAENMLLKASQKRWPRWKVFALTLGPVLMSCSVTQRFVSAVVVLVMAQHMDWPD